MNFHGFVREANLILHVFWLCGFLLPLEMVVLTGIPGSGKSTLVKSRFPEHRRINLDTLKTKSREGVEMIHAIETSENIVIDNTNTTARGRKRYIDIAKAFGIKVRSIYLKCPLEIALARNRSRQGKERVPDFVVKIYNKKLEPPTLDEGFDSCEVIEIVCDEGTLTKD